MLRNPRDLKLRYKRVPVFPTRDSIADRVHYLLTRNAKGDLPFLCENLFEPPPPGQAVHPFHSLTRFCTNLYDLTASSIEGPSLPHTNHSGVICLVLRRTMEQCGPIRRRVPSYRRVGIDAYWGMLFS